jgi:DNA-binding transcriptional LysR family regulator
LLIDASAHGIAVVAAPEANSCYFGMNRRAAPVPQRCSRHTMSILDGIELFTATVEAGSFAAAARKLRLTPSAVSRRVAALEAELGVPLLTRTTRSLTMTNDGRAFHAHCLRIVEELGEARQALARATTRPAGVLRVDAPVALGRTVVAPALPAFLRRYPDLRLDLTLRDGFIDPVAEGVDVAIRIGRRGESSLVMRRLGESRLRIVGAPAYLRKHGTPRRPEDVTEHRCLGYLREWAPAAFKFGVGARVEVAEIDGPFHTNDAEVLRSAAVAGLGLVVLFDFLARDAIAEGKLVPVLDEFQSWPWPIHALYPRNRHLLPKVSVFIDFVARLLRAPTTPARVRAEPAGKR